MDNNNLLSQLKNVHLPDQVSIFPLAAGWYILMVLIISLIVLVGWWKFIKNKKYKLQAYALLAEIEKNQTSEMLSELSILIKRVAMMKYPKDSVHTLFGEKWLQFLDKTGKTNNFSNGAGRDLLNIYQNQTIEYPDKLINVIRQWLGKVL